MSRTVIASFLATVGVVVPASWHLLDATIHSEGKKLRPLQQQLVIDGVRVTLDVDRSLVTTGDKVTARLRAYSEAPKQVAVDLRLLHTSNYGGERVEMPWVQTDKESFTLDARPNGGPEVATQLVLGTRPAKLALTDSFRVYIGKHGDAPPKDHDNYGDGRADYEKMIEDGKAAAVSIKGWSGNSLAVRIVPEGPITAKQPFTVAVHVKNTSGDRILRAPWPQLETVAGLGGGSDTYSFEELDGYDDAAHDKPFERGQDYVRRFRVTPVEGAPAAKDITFVAEAESYDDAPGPVTAGGMEVKTFPVVSGETAKVATK